MEYLKIEKAKDDFVPLIKRTTNLALQGGEEVRYLTR